MNDLIEDLRNPENFPEIIKKVEFVQTHISMVFIGEKTVYKVKKAVNFGFLDFSSLEKRKNYCRKEIELNRRFSEGIYLGVSPIIKKDGVHKIFPENLGQIKKSRLAEMEIVDYAVKMNKIPEEKFLKYQINQHGLSKETLDKIGKKISFYHKKAQTNDEILRFGEIQSVKNNTDENFEQTEKYIGLSIQDKTFRLIKKWTNDFFNQKKSLFKERIKQKKIKDCHGDLHTEHIVLTDPISLIDCIEFNDRFRYGDILADIGFLLMDLEYMDKGEYADLIKRAYFGAPPKNSEKDLLMFYKIYRAYVRGKVTSFQLDDPNLSNEKKEEIIKIAKKYFKLAKSYIEKNNN